MALAKRSHVASKILIHHAFVSARFEDRQGVGNGPKNRSRRRHFDRNIRPVDDDFITGIYFGEYGAEISDGFFFRNVNDAHSEIILPAHPT